MKTDKRMSFYADEKTMQGIEDLAKMRNTNKNALLKEAARKFVISEMKKVIKESEEYQAIMNDANKAFKTIKTFKG